MKDPWRGVDWACSTLESLSKEDCMTAKPPMKRPYEVENYEMWAETPELRMVVLTLAAGQEVPWHWHTNISDTFFCMAGPMVIETRAPREIIELKPGETHVVPAKRAHRVTGKNDGPCKFGILQGVGTYDFNPAGR
jgi:quercetin dioxygenase-like cupin family protein